MKFSQIIQYIVFLSIGVVILVLMYNQQSAAYLEECTMRNLAGEDCSLINKILTDFKNANWFWILIVLGIFMLSNVFRALRWNQLLRPLGHNPRFANSLGTLMLGYFANLGLPRVGELVRSATMSKYENIPLEQTIATIVIGRIVDVIFLAIVIALSFVLAFDILSNYFQENLKFDPSTFLYVSIFLVLLGFLGLYILNVLAKKSTTSDNAIIKKIGGIVTKFLDGIKSITKVENKGLFLFYSIGIWLCYYLMTYLCFFAYEPTSHLGPIAGLVVFVFGTLGIVFPSPGGMGSYHFLVTKALIILGISSVASFSFAMILFFAIQLFCNILFGIVALFALPIINSGQAKAS